jgi:hypothetical protein
MKMIQHHMTNVSTNVAPLYVYITRSGMNGITSSFLSEGLSLPLMVKYSLKQHHFVKTLSLEIVKVPVVSEGKVVNMEYYVLTMVQQ